MHFYLEAHHLVVRLAIDGDRHDLKHVSPALGAHLICLHDTCEGHKQRWRVDES